MFYTGCVRQVNLLLWQKLKPVDSTLHVHLAHFGTSFIGTCLNVDKFMAGSSWAWTCRGRGRRGR